MIGKRFRSYSGLVFRAFPRGFRAAAFVGKRRNVLVCITRPWWTREAAEAALVRLMRSKLRR